MTNSERRDFSAAAKTWDDNPGRVELAAAVVDAIIKRVPLSKGTHLLDYGAGTGLVTLGLQPYVESVVAADSAPGMLEVLDSKIAASDLENVSTVLLDLEQDELPEAHFGAITSSMTMHHIENAAEVIGRLVQMLQPNGYLAIADLDLDGGEFHADPTGVRHNGFDRSEIARFFAESGLIEVTVSTAHTLEKDVSGRGLREFTIFLATGRKPG